MNKLTLREARQTLGLSRKDLAEISQISAATIYRIESSSSPFAVREDTAALLARSLACTVNEIYWPNGRSHLGKPPQTKSSTTHNNLRIDTICKGCNLTLPASGKCDNCL